MLVPHSHTGALSGGAPAHAPVPHAVALRAHAAMGVADILPLLKYASVRDRFYRRYRGKVVGVDAFVWLHELVAKHAHAVVVRRDTGAVVRELVYRCRILLSKDVTPYLVFDGKRHVAKHATDEARRRRRLEKQAFVEELIEAGDADVELDVAVLRVAALVTEDLVVASIAGLRAAAPLQSPRGERAEPTDFDAAKERLRVFERWRCGGGRAGSTAPAQRRCSGRTRQRPHYWRDSPLALPHFSALQFWPISKTSHVAKHAANLS